MKIHEIFEGKDTTEVSVPVDFAEGDGNYNNFEKDSDVDRAVADTGKKYNIKGHVLDYTGQAGGWPEVMFTGTKENLRKFLMAYHADDVQEVERDLKGAKLWDPNTKKYVK